MFRFRSSYWLCVPVLLTSITACVSTPSSEDDHTAATEQAVASNGVSATLAITSSWGSGYCANVTLSNGGTTQVSSWTVVLGTGGSTVTQIWGATDTVSGTVVTASNASYDGAIAPGGSTSFGFCGSGTAQPTLTSVAINGTPSSSSSSSSSSAHSSSSSSSSAHSSSSSSSSAHSSSSSSSSAHSSSSSSSSTSTTKFVGNITTNGSPRSDTSKYWNQLTPENEGKWGSVQPTSQSQWNWTGLDNAYNYAKQHNMKFKHHNFVWGSQQPSWITSLSSSQQAAAVENWIKAVCNRYPAIDLIDVVNEPPPHTTPSYINAIGGTGASGYDWIVQTFKWARQYCPNSVLILNDYNNIEYSDQSAHFVDIVKKIKAAGAPIDAMGAQAHGVSGMSTSTVQGMIDSMSSSTGLPMYITEYDINLADDTQQKNVMQSQFTMFYTDKNIHGITLWGYIEGATWETNSGLMTSGGSMRPAMSWLMSYLGR